MPRSSGGAPKNGKGRRGAQPRLTANQKAAVGFAFGLLALWTLSRPPPAVVDLSPLCALTPDLKLPTFSLEEVVLHGGYDSGKCWLVISGRVYDVTSWLGAHLAKAYGATIRCNAIAPGFIVAKQNKSLLMNEDGTTSDRGKRILAKTPMQRFGSPDELNGALIFLCSDASKFMTGSVVTVDGGFTASSGV